MVRYIILDCGGQIYIPSDEPCPSCDAHPRKVESYGVAFMDDSAKYRCTECDHEWPAVLQ